MHIGMFLTAIFTLPFIPARSHCRFIQQINGTAHERFLLQIDGFDMLVYLAEFLSARSHGFARDYRYATHVVAFDETLVGQKSKSSALKPNQLQDTVTPILPCRLKIS